MIGIIKVLELTNLHQSEHIKSLKNLRLSSFYVFKDKKTLAKSFKILSQGIKKLRKLHNETVIERETDYMEGLVKKPVASDIELF